MKSESPSKLFWGTAKISFGEFGICRVAKYNLVLLVLAVANFNRMNLEILEEIAELQALI